MDSEPYVITSISLATENRYLIEFIEKKRLRPKSRSERWAARDSLWDEDMHVPPFLFGRSMIPITLTISAAEFNRLQLKIGQEVSLQIVPVEA